MELSCFKFMLTSLCGERIGYSIIGARAMLLIVRVETDNMNFLVHVITYASDKVHHMALI